MAFRYEIVTKQKRADQIGLRLQCDEQRQAEEIHRKLRQAGFTISSLMSATHSDYTHFVYVTVRENDLNNTVFKIEAHIKALNDVDVAKSKGWGGVGGVGGWGRSTYPPHSPHSSSPSAYTMREKSGSSVGVLQLRPL